MAWRPFSDLGTTVSWGLAGGRHLLEDRRQGDLDSAADRINGWAGSGAQSGSATILFDLDLTEVGKIVDDALPFELATACRQTVRQFLAQHQGEEGAEDVAADAGIGFVEDRPGGEQRLCGFEGVLHGEEVAVSQDDLEGGDFRVGAQHEQAVEAGVGLDPRFREGRLLARSMTKPSPSGVLRKRRKPLLATSALSPCASLRSRPAISSARASASFLASSSLRQMM